MAKCHDSTCVAFALNKRICYVCGLIPSLNSIDAAHLWPCLYMSTEALHQPGKYSIYIFGYGYLINIKFKQSKSYTQKDIQDLPRALIRVNLISLHNSRILLLFDITVKCFHDWVCTKHLLQILAHTLISHIIKILKVI